MTHTGRSLKIVAAISDTSVSLCSSRSDAVTPSRPARSLICAADSSPDTYSTFPARSASRPATSVSSVLLPIPGSPPIRISEPGTMPPPSTRSSSPIPVCTRCSDAPEGTSGSRCGFPGPTHAERRRVRGPRARQPARRRGDRHRLIQRPPLVAPRTLPQPLRRFVPALPADVARLNSLCHRHYYTSLTPRRLSGRMENRSLPPCRRFTKPCNRFTPSSSWTPRSPAPAGPRPPWTPARRPPRPPAHARDEAEQKTHDPAPPSGGLEGQ